MTEIKEKILCAVKNPSIRKNQSWFYNIFLERIIKNKKYKRNEVKINWLMTLTEDEIETLRDMSCEVITLADNIEFDTDEESNIKEIKNGFMTLFNLFEKAMKDKVIQNKLRTLLSNGDGTPNKNYNTIIKTKKLIGE